MMPSRLDREGPLSFAERGCLAGEVIITYGRIRVMLARHELDEAVAVARLGRNVALSSSADQRKVGFRLAHIVLAVLRLVPGDTRCLNRTLVLTRMLARRGIGCRVLIGVRVAPRFGAHAWPELAGQPLMEPIEPGGERFVEL